MNNIFLNAKHLYSYDAFIELCQQLADNDSATSFSNDEKFVHFSKLNLQRMLRLNKTIQLNDDTLEWVQALPKQSWYMITEGWCGDSAQSLPYIAALANSNPNIELKICLREENPSIMDQYLTNGSKSIPVLAMFIDDNEIGRWGPRPEGAQALFIDLKSKNTPFEEFEIALQQWYNKDKGQEILSELKSLLASK